MNKSAGKGAFKNMRKSKRMPCNSRIGYAALDKNHTAVIRNISDGGIFLDTANPIPAGRDIALTLQMDRGQEPIMIVGQVVWNSPGGMGVRFKMGFDASLIHHMMDNL